MDTEGGGLVAVDVDLTQITILPTHDGVLAECRLCDGHKTYYEVTLAQIVADMADHLARYHAPDA